MKIKLFFVCFICYIWMHLYLNYILFLYVHLELLFHIVSLGTSFYGALPFIFCSPFFLNPIYDGVLKGPPTSFFSITFRNVRINPPPPPPPPNFWLSVLNPFPHSCKISRSYLPAVPIYWTLTKATLQEKGFFWSSPCEIEIMITFLIGMLELPKLGHMTISTI